MPKLDDDFKQPTIMSFKLTINSKQTQRGLRNTGASLTDLRSAFLLSHELFFRPHFLYSISNRRIVLKKRRCWRFSTELKILLLLLINSLKSGHKVKCTIKELVGYKIAQV